MASSSSPTNTTNIHLPPSGNIAEVRTWKQSLRKRVRGMLKAMPEEDIQRQSLEVWQRLFALPAYTQAKSVALFLSMPSGEIDTSTALKRVLDDGKVLYVPRVGLDFEKCEMDLLQVSSSSSKNSTGMFYNTWPRNKWGIPEPPSSEDLHVATPGDIDLIVVPGVAFDATGARLGQGKGYYDRFISRMSPTVKDTTTATAKPPILVAVGLTPQLLRYNERVPTLEHDFPMNVVLTPQCTIDLNGNNE